MMYCALMRQTWFESAQKHLTDLERLAFYEACFRYEFTGEIPTESTCKYGNVLLMFDMVRVDLQSDREKAERIAERNRVNGLGGGRPKKDYNRPQENENPEKPNETQSNPMGNSGLPLHYTTLHNTTKQQAARDGGGVLDGSFFDAQIWPRLNRSGKYNTRHRICLAKWSEYSERKRQAITKTVLSDMFAGADNPYYYLEDFAEPEPRYLTGIQCEQEWRAGRSVFVVDVGGVKKYVSAADVQEFELTTLREMTPIDD